MNAKIEKATQGHSGGILEVTSVFPQNHGLVGLEIIYSNGLIIPSIERPGEGK